MEGKHLERISSVGIHYLIYFPPEYDIEVQSPLLLFLHGSGERGTNLGMLKKYGPPKIVEKKIDLPFIVVSPQCPSGETWQVEKLKNLLDEIIMETNADVNRIYLSGVSMGAYGAWDLAIKYPQMFAALVPICGGGDTSKVYNVKDIPTWVFHGAKDTVVPISESKKMVEELKNQKGNVKFTIYEHARHDCWTETFNNDKLFDWLSEQNRNKRSNP